MRKKFLLRILDERISVSSLQFMLIHMITNYNFKSVSSDVKAYNICKETLKYCVIMIYNFNINLNDVLTFQIQILLRLNTYIYWLNLPCRKKWVPIIPTAGNMFFN